MDLNAFDPTAPLPAPPDPWRGSDTPSSRSGPPYHMTDMIAAEPHLARRLLGRLAVSDSPAAELARAVRDALGDGRPIVFTGCGTSEHGALGAADIVRAAAREAGLPAGHGAVSAEQALELALDPPSGGLVVGISHEGGSAATNRALEASRDAGSTVALVTAGPGSPGARLAGILVTTGEMDQSWCHTVGYVAPLLAAAAVGGHLTGEHPSPEAVASLMAEAAAGETAAEAIADQLAGVTRVIVLGSGADRTAGRELVLKIEEASWLPAAYRDLETFLHGHLPATDEQTGLVLIATDRHARADRLVRGRQALAAARVLRHRASAILAAGADASVASDLTPAGRLLVPDAPDLPAPVAALLGSATALQLLTERIARARGTNPDPIRRDDARYVEAAVAADG